MSEQELREQIAQQIEGYADFLATHHAGSTAERAGLHAAARIARDLDHYRTVCDDCGSRTSGITPEWAEKYAAQHRERGHSPRIEDERGDAC